MVIEEKFVNKYRVAPLQAVGWEGLFVFTNGGIAGRNFDTGPFLSRDDAGFFGFVVLSLLLVPMYFIPVGNTIFQNPGGQLEDAIDGFYQIYNSWQVALGVLGELSGRTGRGKTNNSSESYSWPSL